MPVQRHSFNCNSSPVPINQSLLLLIMFITMTCLVMGSSTFLQQVPNSHVNIPKWFLPFGNKFRLSNFLSQLWLIFGLVFYRYMWLVGQFDARLLLKKDVPYSKRYAARLFMMNLAYLSPKMRLRNTFFRQRRVAPQLCLNTLWGEKKSWTLDHCAHFRESVSIPWKFRDKVMSHKHYVSHTLVSAISELLCEASSKTCAQRWTFYAYKK